VISGWKALGLMSIFMRVGFPRASSVSTRRVPTNPEPPMMAIFFTEKYVGFQFLKKEAAAYHPTFPYSLDYPNLRRMAL
jgi:hypothetical protein